MSTFRFKQFSVCSDGAAMKVGTDGVLLGCACLLDIPCADDSVGKGLDCSRNEPKKILDIGTGTGLVALLVANRLSNAGLRFDISGIDIEASAARQAQENFDASPWKGSLHAIHSSLTDFGLNHTSSLEGEGGSEGKEIFDLIVCNPPYYDNSLPSKGEDRNAARHTVSLSFRDVLDFASPMIGGALAPDGIVSLILPASDETVLLRYASSVGLRLLRLLRIRTTPRKAVSRIIAEFGIDAGRRNSGPSSVENCIEDITILNPDGTRSEQYISLTKDFYL